MKRYSVPQTVDFINGLLETLDVEHATLTGSSLGGLIAWRLASRYPARVDKLVLIAPGAYSINGVTEEPVEVPVAVSTYFEQSSQPIINFVTSGMFGDATRMDPELPLRIGAFTRREGNSQALIERLEVFTLPDPTEALSAIHVPTLLLWGDRDSIITVDHAARLVEDMPNAHAIIYPGLGHIPHEEDPTSTLPDLRDFLNTGLPD